MPISQAYFDQQPLLIRQGAATLWGTPLGQTLRAGKIRHLFKLDDFFAEICYSVVDGCLTCVCSSAQQPDEIRSISDLDHPDAAPSTLNDE